MRPMLLFLAAVAAVGCEDDDEAIRGEVQSLVLAAGTGTPATAAAERLARHGRRALPAVEAALHTAEPAGRKNLILALRKIGDGDAAPLLRHVALFDPAPDVRREAEWTLRSWAAGRDARGERARAALRELDERREREEAG
jgi:HEAT repeat protein